MSSHLNIILNNKIVKGNAGETVLELAQRNNIVIPTLCHDPRLEPFSSCYVCVVEIEGARGLQTSCSTVIAEGMKITTESEKVKKARKMALDLLLSNHYADCMGPCKQTCPAGVDVQGYISYIEKGMYHDAVALIKETNPLPAVCGRVCVRPCEVACRRNLLDEEAPVGIDYLKRFASDIDLESPNKWKPVVKPSTSKKVAVIGAGPGGVSCGFFLQKEGHQVDIYEAAPKGGGWLRYGIPEYRLPNDILQKEIDNVTELGVNIFYNHKLGDNVSFSDLKKKYDAVILTIGSQKGTRIGCEGDDAGNVFSGIDFLKEMEMTGKRADFSGKTVAVVGGGNTAMDCCRTSLRCGAKKVYVIYRRTEKEMPANPIEIHESKLEGVEYLFLTNPTLINKDENGNVKSVTCLRMELGEPDASGRRRPVPVEGSEFDIELDYMLAAIGQKTHVNFLEDINAAYGSNGSELKLNRWGDLDANSKTLQTGIPNVFAAGDGVTGPATLIEAIGQAKIASRSCHQFLSGEPIVPEKPEFLSKRENFKEQVSADYLGKFKRQLREEMPTLDPKDRQNFREVELGYASETIALNESLRCFECGCAEYFTCDLKRLSTEYDAEQKRFSGEFKEYPVDFRHPYIEIDNNKCILCSRCIRICRDVVGANALGLINRGFETYVAPSMGDRLQDTFCESCGMCISTCPTGAIAENFKFKPGPVKLDPVQTICNYCSIGCAITLNHKNGFVMQTTGANGMVNKDGNLCRFPKFGYNYINENSRITKPLLKTEGKFRETTFEEAFKLIADKVKAVKPEENIFFAGARLTNEEMYLIRKLAQGGARTGNISSFHYLGRGNGYSQGAADNVPFEQLKGASKFYLLGSEINMDNAVAGFMINNLQYKEGIPVELVTVHPDSPVLHKANAVLVIKSYYYFVKAVNHYLLSQAIQNGLFIKDRCDGFEDYRESLLKEKFEDLIKKSGIPAVGDIVDFANGFNKEINTILVFSEKEVDTNTAVELRNLAMITGKLSKTASGLICLKEKNNAQGLFDMGIHPADDDPGNQEMQKKIKESWGLKELPPRGALDVLTKLENKAGKNLLIFGEDPVGCAQNREQVIGWLSNNNFMVVQDYFMTDTAAMADLFLPASMPFEKGGSFTNTQKVIQEFEAVLPPKVEMNSIKQLSELIRQFGLEAQETPKEVLSEALSLLPAINKNKRFEFVYTSGTNPGRLFDHGCDNVVKRFEEEFVSLLEFSPELAKEEATQ